DGARVARAIEPQGLGALLCASSIATLAVRIVAEHAAQLGTQERLMEHLDAWLSRYVMTEADAQGILRAARPLRAATIELSEATGGLALVLSLDLAYQVQPAHARIRIAVPVGVRPREESRYAVPQDDLVRWVAIDGAPPSSDILGRYRDVFTVAEADRAV